MIEIMPVRKFIETKMQTCRIVSIDVECAVGDCIIERLDQLVSTEDSVYICAANVHMCMEAFDDVTYQEVVKNADLVVPDGRPLVWAQRLLGYKDVQQVRGMDLMLALCERSAQDGTPVGFYGGSSEVLELLNENLISRYPDLNVVCRISPPFRILSGEEDQHYIDEINTSGVRFLFVGLGCPKQERWMAEHKDSLDCVMLGVGAAFDFIAGNKRHAPKWMQWLGLEWFFRFCAEPRRLWRRYFYHNPRFIWHFGKQWLRYRRSL